MKNSALLLLASLALAGCSGSHGSGGGFASTVAPSTSAPATSGPASSAPGAPRSTPPPPGTPIPPRALPVGPVGGARARGVDVSKWNGTIDWKRAAASGVAFGIARVSDGKNTHDATFLPNWTAMKAQGLCRGVYQFFRPSQDPIVQADYMLSQIGTLGPGDLPPMCDVETLDGVTAGQVATNLAAWIAHVKARTGFTPGIYSSKRVWNELNNPTGFSDSDLWVANWGVSSPAMPPIWRDWTFWQYSAKGVVPGISGDVDEDVFNGTVEDLRAYAGIPAPAAFFRGLAVDSTGLGVWAATCDGGVLAYGDATFRGTAAGKQYAEPFLGIVRTGTGFGYWLFAADGAVRAFGDALHAGDLAGKALASPVVAMAATPTGKGYWLVARDGGVSAFGDAASQGQPAPRGTTVAVAATPSGKGYWVASSEGDVEAFGDAAALGGATGKIAEPIVAMAATPSGKGYWLAVADGSVHAFGDAPAVSYSGPVARKAAIAGIAATLTGKGYWLVAEDGAIFAVGDAADVGQRPR